MNNAFLIFIGVFITFAGSWYGMVLQPYQQLGGQKEVVLASGERYPAPRGGTAKAAADHGAEVYRREGCYYCHTQRLQADAPSWNIYTMPFKAPTDEAKANALTNELVKAVMMVSRLNPRDALNAIRRAPQLIKGNVTEQIAEQARKAAEGTSKPEAIGIQMLGSGPDIYRGWGERSVTALDYLQDDHVMLGTVRMGPDLASIGTRKPEAFWHLGHLYRPASVATVAIGVDGVEMPSYDHLFYLRERSSISATNRPGSLPLTTDWEPPTKLEFNDGRVLYRQYRSVDGDTLTVAGPGNEGKEEFSLADLARVTRYEVVPKADARALAAYIISLKATTSLPRVQSPLEIEEEEEDPQ